MNRTVGTCGACGGRVSAPAAWMGLQPPVPTCEACGRQAAWPWGPVVEMAPGRRLSPGLEAEIEERVGRREAGEAKARAETQAFLRRSQGQAGAKEAGSPVHDNYLAHGYFASGSGAAGPAGAGPAAGGKAGGR